MQLLIISLQDVECWFVTSLDFLLPWGLKIQFNISYNAPSYYILPYLCGSFCLFFFLIYLFFILFIFICCCFFFKKEIFSLVTYQEASFYAK